VDFKNTIIILTSNLGSQYLLEGIEPDGSIRPEAQEAVMAELKRSFRPEFLNRLDEIVFYKPLTKENVRAIIDLLVASLAKRLAEKNLGLNLTDAAKDVIIEQSYDPVFGARPMKRFLQSKVETLIARTILEGRLGEGDTVTVDAENGELICK
jgi:ATP-dependent Clp protease ATP-binding subunit ClpB